MILNFVRRMLFGPSPYLGCLDNKELDAELAWLKKKEKT